MFYSANGNFKNNLENFTEVKNITKKYKMITPATMFKFFNKQNIAIVNTLENPYFVTKNPFSERFLEMYYPGKKFMEMEVLEKKFRIC